MATQVEATPVIIYRNIEVRDKYNHSEKGRECRKRYLEKNKEINTLWIARAIIKKKVVEQTEVVNNLPDENKVKKRYLKLLTHNLQRLQELNEKINEIRPPKN